MLKEVMEENTKLYNKIDSLNEKIRKLESEMDSKLVKIALKVRNNLRSLKKI